MSDFTEQLVAQLAPQATGLRITRGVILADQVILHLSSTAPQARCPDCVAEVRSFAAGLQADCAAVEAGLRLRWSQGQTEGQIHRLKLLKRHAYGRAGLALLRQRVLAQGDSGAAYEGMGQQADEARAA